MAILIGRDAELGRLRARLDDAAAGRAVAALRQAGIRGRTATVRRERYEAR